MEKKEIKNAKIVGYIYETTDYDMFSTIRGNRKIDHAKKIGKSIDKNGALLSPITVNDNFEIIDGQNRKTALQERNLPIQFIVGKGYGIEEVRALNDGAKNWKILDYIKSYAEDGAEGCQQVMKFINAYKGQLNTSALIRVAFDGRLSVVEDEKDYETYVFTNEEEAYRIADALLKFKEVDLNKPTIFQSRDFAMAVRNVLRVEGFDIELMINKIRLQQRQFVRCANPSQYIDMLEKLYNYRNRQPLHFDF